jgi:hypothetical protein
LHKYTTILYKYASCFRIFFQNKFKVQPRIEGNLPGIPGETGNALHATSSATVEFGRILEKMALEAEIYP